MKLEDKSSVDDKSYIISLLVYVPGEYKKITLIVNKSIQIIFEKDYVKMWRLTFHIKLSLVNFNIHVVLII